MPRMRSYNGMLKIAAALGIAGSVATPALAADTPPIAGDFAENKIAAWAEAVDVRPPDPGPFVPVAGGFDYGTSENAFGAARSGHTHAGQDMMAASGTPLVAVDDAVVAETGSDGGQGNYIHLYDRRHGVTYVYMHMLEPAKAAAGEPVEAGESLGSVGCTGSCWGDHLHFEIRDGRGFEGEATDPLPELKRWKQLEKPAE